jgi:hypothetical protein
MIILSVSLSFSLLWRYSQTWALASSIPRVHLSQSFAKLVQFFHFNILLASLSNASIDLLQVLPNSLLPSMHFQCSFFFLGALSSSIFNTRPPTGVKDGNGTRI